MGNRLRTYRDCLNTIIRDHWTKSGREERCNLLAARLLLLNRMEIFNLALLGFHARRLTLMDQSLVCLIPRKKNKSCNGIETIWKDK